MRVVQGRFDACLRVFSFKVFAPISTQTEATSMLVVRQSCDAKSCAKDVGGDASKVLQVLLGASLCLLVRA